MEIGVDRSNALDATFCPPTELITLPFYSPTLNTLLRFKKEEKLRKINQEILRMNISFIFIYLI